MPYKYNILSQLQVGGMGIVFKSEEIFCDPEEINSPALNPRIVAIKVMRREFLDNSDLQTRFQREASIMAKISHPNIVAVYNYGQYFFEDCGFHDTDLKTRIQVLYNISTNAEPMIIPYMVMEFVDGETLQNLLSTKSLSFKKVANIFETCARSLHFLHQASIIHRDIKPSNIMINSNNEPKIMDFGVAKEFCMPTAGMGSLGTLGYAPPEQTIHTARRRTTPQNDIYSLGATLYYALTGSNPCQDQYFLTTKEHEDPRYAVATFIRPNPTKIPDGIVEICMKCIKKKPEDRYMTALELAEDLQKFQENLTISIKNNHGSAKIACISIKNMMIRFKNRLIPQMDRLMLYVILGCCVFTFFIGMVCLLQTKFQTESSRHINTSQEQLEKLRKNTKDIHNIQDCRKKMQDDLDKVQAREQEFYSAYSKVPIEKKLGISDFSDSKIKTASLPNIYLSSVKKENEVILQIDFNVPENIVPKNAVPSVPEIKPSDKITIEISNNTPYIITQIDQELKPVAPKAPNVAQLLIMPNPLRMANMPADKKNSHDELKQLCCWQGDQEVYQVTTKQNPQNNMPTGEFTLTIKIHYLQNFFGNDFTKGLPVTSTKLQDFSILFK